MAICYSGTSTDDVANHINHDLKLLRLWFDQHKMILSDKTKIMFFRLSKQHFLDVSIKFMYHTSSCNELNCSVDCLRLDVVENFKYLGVILDSTLCWKSHVDKLRKDLNVTIRSIYLIRPVCSSAALLKFYHACVGSRLAYGITCWGGVVMSTLQPLVCLQKHIIRSLFFKSRMHSSWPLFLFSKILPLQHLYVFKVLRLFYLRSGHRMPRVVQRYSFRSNQWFLFLIPKFNFECFRRYFLVSGPSIFNHLPLYIRHQIDSTSFLLLVKEWLFEHQKLDFLFRVTV